MCSPIYPARFYVFDIHGDIDIEGASTVMFSEQTGYGLNPLRVNPDVHFGGVRKRIQEFMATMNSVMRELGPKQQATLRNVLYDVYERHGFRQDDPSTWAINEDETHLLSNGSDGRLYIDVPIAEVLPLWALAAVTPSYESVYSLPEARTILKLITYVP